MSIEPIASSDTVAMLQSIERMTSAGHDPTAMYSLYKAMIADRAKQAYAAAMNRCQAEMPVVVRDAENSHTRTSYAKLETICKLAKPIYLKHGFSVSFNEGAAARPDWFRVIADVIHEDGHIEQYYRDFPSDNVGAKGVVNKTEIQGKASSESYAVRYLLTRIFGITIADTDQDGNAAVDSSLVTDDQAKALADVIAASGRDLGQVLIWIGQKAGRPIPTLADVPASLHAEIMRALAVTVTAQ